MSSMLGYNRIKRCKIYKSHKDGYTLTEVLFSIIIITFILAISTPVYYRLATVLPKEAMLTGLSQKLFYLLSDARKTSVLSNDIVCIKYSNKVFRTFIFYNLDEVPDANKILSAFNFSSTDYNSVKFYFNNVEVTNSNITMYVVDGIFVRKVSNDQIDTNFSNSQFKFTLGEKSIVIKLDRSFPIIQEQ
ncbi:MAG: hypothetical protein ACK4MM_05710 [Fervidobacterium sp.]